MTQTGAIGNTDVLSAALGATTRTEHARTNAAHTGARQTPAIAGSDSSTNLSSLGSVLASVDPGTSDVRADKVAALKSAIDGGTYSVPASAIADKLLDGMLG